MLEFGCALAGVVLVTVNPAFRAHELEYVLKQSRAAGVFVVEAFRGNPMHATVQQVAPARPELRHVIRFDQWLSFIDRGDAPGIDLPSVKSNDPVVIQYTSGTTGFPKGALLHHRGLANNGAHTAQRMGIRDGAVWITTMPLFHTGGCVCCVLGAVSVRATQVLVEAFEPGLVLELFDTYGGAAMVGVPTMLVAMMEHASFASTDLSQVQGICSGGSTVPAALVRRFEDKMGARGYCTAEGRLKDMIIRGGENIYPRELEELLFKHPSVGEVAVVGLPDDKWGEVVAAFLRPAPGQPIRKDELIEYTRQHLAPHKTPRHWFVVDAFPLTGSGNIQKFKLREHWKAGEFSEI